MFKLNPVITLSNMNSEAYALLAQQKLALQELIANDAPDNILEGLVCLIDHIQDKCVSENDIPEDVVFPKIIAGSIQEEIQFPKPNIYAKGTPVLSSDGTIKGKLTGGSRHCGMEGCTGKALAVRWEDGKLTYPCTKGMDYTNGTWKIG
jgi:hypothetical protein